MRNYKAHILIAGLALAFFSSPLRAHHAFAAEFDGNKPVHFHGRNRDEG